MTARIAILGAGGRMGRALIRAISDTQGAALAAAVEYDGSPLIGQDAAILAGLPAGKVAIGKDGAAGITAGNVAIEFSTPAATVKHARIAAKNGIAYVAGTTGMATCDEDVLREAAERIPVVYAANYSVGVTLLADLVRRTAGRLGPEFDIEIVEMHHRHKVDAPSGTALALGRAAAAGRGVTLDDVAVRGRDGVTGAREKGTIGFASLRGGDVPGDHTVIFAGDGERLELSHRASGRDIFARGALRAALWAIGKEPGLYNMRDVLGLSE
ncbi:MAG TPA: 4-hydroxy-tetrahydrodipicolinate reductase [Alphaproteobacteria bacterium]|nr:4-hydroxy-tetrahydrodipicolinate reductase [Alphaproteobacteria bacterium]